MWRFQLEGAGDAFTTQLRSIAEGPVEIEVVRTIPTVCGFVTEHVETQHTPDGAMTARRIHLCEVRDGRICAVTTYCNGGWDDELRSRHAAEAPMSPSLTGTDLGGIVSTDRDVSRPDRAVRAAAAGAGDTGSVPSNAHTSVRQTKRTGLKATSATADDAETGWVSRSRGSPHAAASNAWTNGSPRSAWSNW